MEKKITFLTAAITDAQELIRFIDTKTAIVITILGAYIVAIFSVLDKIISNYNLFSLMFWSLISCFSILLIFCVVITARIINPTNNPTKNIALGNTSLPSLQFYLPTNNYNNIWYPFFNSEKFNLSNTFESYSSELKNKQIVKSLTFELLKISYIRNVKNDRFKILIYFLIATTAVFFATYILFQIEIAEINRQIELLKNKNCL
ncbi:MAG: hypothetical protein EAZ75_11570 [Flavobacteriia bacterium]|jgi:hypothetical protein|uniref:hypothetical protein n=1 Tax=Flavobacterium sp. TaxID=239 RepID=UPI002978BD7C|nr:MAG: hypothetical protein EAZ75_11570 [Flavobacteriia bacterium]